MKKALLISLLTICNFSAFAQNITWSTPVSVAPANNDNNRPRIALDASGNPLVLWGNAAMNGQAMFSRWSGSSFTAPIALSTMSMSVFNFSWAGPEIASKGDTVYATFKNQPEDTGKIYLARSFDGGQTWQPLTVADANLGVNSSRFSTLAVSANGNPIVGYMKFAPGFTDARYTITQSTDFGASFGSEVTAGKMSTEACDCCPSALEVSGNTVIMFYRDNDANIRTIWAQISNDGGNTFPDSLEVDNTNWMVMSCPSSGPDAIIVGDTAYTVFRSSPTGTRVYLSKSSIGNPQLINCAQFAADFTGLQQQEYPRIANTGNAAAIVWKQVILGTSKLCFSFTGNVVNGFPVAYDTIASSGVMSADIAIRPGEIHVVWEDMNSGTVMYRKGTYTVVSAPELNVKTQQIQVHPNPATNYFSISGVSEAAQCLLTDNAGKSIILNAENGSGGNRFSLRGIAAGVYMVSITDENGKACTGKLIVK